jgi:2-methylcitrate dehydratase
MGSISRTMAEFAVGLKYEDLPDEVIHEAKRLLLDSVGCALGGYLTHDCRIAHMIIEVLGGNPHATVIGSGLRTSVVNVALLNALMVRALDYNDIYWKADPSHPSDIIPAGLALAEDLSKGGADVIVGIVIGHELEMRWSEAAEPGIREVGWHHATLTQLVSPFVAGRMLDLTVDQMVNALGICASHNLTLGAVTAGHLTMMKNTVDPMATQAGVIAAMLAKHGYTGPESVIDGREGIFHTLSNVEWHADILTDGLGTKFKTPEISYKAFPTEYLTHSPLSATIHLCQEHGITHADVEAVLVKTIKRGAEILSDPAKYKPTTRETADHSLPYCIAAAIVDGHVLPTSFDNAHLKDERIWALLPKIKVVDEPEFDALFPATQSSQVTITTTRGETFTRRVDYAKGDPRDPLSDEEIEAKFHSLAAPLLSEARRAEVVEAIWRLEGVDNIGSLMALLVAGVKGTA